MPMRPTLPAASLAVLAALFGMAAAVSRMAQADGPAASSESTSVSPADPVKGKVAYEKNCVNCHRQDGTGGVKSIPTGNPSRNFRDPAFWKDHTDTQLKTAIEVGFPKSGMVAWKGVLSPREIRNVIAYMRARFQPKGAAAPAPPSAKTKAK